MKWIEIIELRTAGNITEVVTEKLNLMMEEIERDNNENSMNLFVHVNVNSDFSIHIEHTAGKIENTGSELGLHIASNLKVFGLVNHNVWQKIAGK
jgi:hypothetical protein